MINNNLIFKSMFENEITNNQQHKIIPYIQMYEFEALLFSDSEKMANGLNTDNIATSLSPNNPDLSQFRAGKLMLQEVKNCIKNTKI